MFIICSNTSCFMVFFYQKKCTFSGNKNSPKVFWVSICGQNPISIVLFTDFTKILVIRVKFLLVWSIFTYPRKRVVNFVRIVCSDWLWYELTWWQPAMTDCNVRLQWQVYDSSCDSYSTRFQLPTFLRKKMMAKFWLESAIQTT